MLSQEEYIEDHIDPEPAALRALRRHTHLHRLYPRMCSDHAQGRLLVMLTKMIKPRRVLELGTFSGYSALCFAEGMANEGVVDTIEVDTEYAQDLEELFADTIVRLHIGDAEELIPSVVADGDTIDLVFIDANKRRYVEYYELLVPLLQSGAYIFADNTLWSDKVLSPDANDAQTMGLRAFNDRVADDPRVSCVILPIRDGMTIIRKN